MQIEEFMSLHACNILFKEMRFKMFKHMFNIQLTFITRQIASTNAV